MLFSKDMSLRVSIDMIAYITEFILPFWMISEICFQAFKYVKESPNCISSSLLVSIVVCGFFTTGLLYSIRKYNHQSRFQSVIQAVQTGVFLCTVWFPIVVFIVFKIIFFPKTMDWGKTTHGVTKIDEDINSVDADDTAQEQTV